MQLNYKVITNSNTFRASLLILFIPVISFTQSFWNNATIKLGVALSKQDRRLFYFTGAQGLLNREDSKLDYEYNLSLQKTILDTKILSIDMGIGYSESNATFSRPFAHSALNGGLTKELRFVKRYTINYLILPISNSFFLNNKHKWFFRLDILPKFGFRKSAIDLSFQKRETKWDLEFQSLSIYPGISYSINPRVQVATLFRLVYINRIDEVIFNHTLFPQRDPPFLQKKFDTYNPFKLWFTMNFALNGKR